MDRDRPLDLRNDFKQQASEIIKHSELREACIFQLKREKIERRKLEKRLQAAFEKEQERIREEEEQERAFLEAAGKPVPKSKLGKK